MAEIVKIEGVDKLRSQFKSYSKNLEKRWEQGLKAGGLILQRRSQEIVPIDTGDLRRSARTRHEGKGFKIVVRVVYLMSYAIYVHEMTGSPRLAGRQYKFLETAARESKKLIVETVRKVVQGGKK